MITRHSLISRILLIALTAGPGFAPVVAGTASANEVVVLRSGNAAVGLPDPFINATVGVGGTPLSSAPFTPADFDAACGSRSAVVCQAHPVWLQQLGCDPLAKWIGTDPSATPASALYCYNFDLKTCCISHATLNFCWASDDNIGDAVYGGSNADGVYINGVAVSPSISGGNYAAETQAVADITGLLHCGNNRLEVYNRDAAFVVSGVMFSATIDVVDCGTPTQDASWGVIKALYR